MKQYKKKGYRFYEYSFNSLDNFLKYIEEGSTNTNVFDECNLSSKEGTYKFTKTSSLDEAIRLCKCGWDDNFDKLLDLKKRVDEKFLRVDTSVKRSKDYIGFVPSVPDYLKGNPKDMWRLQHNPNFRIIQIYVNVTYSSYTDTTSIYNRGAIILSIIDILEKAGYAVNLIFFECSYCDNEVVIAYFNLKEESSNLNLKKMHFPLCHPSFLRRLIFRLEEITPVRASWEAGYGHVFERDDLIELLDLNKEDAIVFTTPSDMRVKGNNIYEDLESVLKKNPS